jgi:hypothetical protein
MALFQGGEHHLAAVPLSARMGIFDEKTVKQGCYSPLLNSYVK